MDFSGLQRRSYSWLHEQVADRIEKAIRSGELKPGEMLPGERELSQQADVSRAVVRRAFGILRGKGLVITRPDRGTFVADPGPPPQT